MFSESVGAPPLTLPNQVEAFDDLYCTLALTIHIMQEPRPIVIERIYTLVVFLFLFLVYAVSIFPELALNPKEIVSRQRGTGCVDWVIGSRDDPSQCIAVTTSDSCSEHVQLDAISSERKQEHEQDDKDDNSTLVISYGIQSTGSTWTFFFGIHNNSIAQIWV